MVVVVVAADETNHTWKTGRCARLKDKSLFLYCQQNEKKE